MVLFVVRRGSNDSWHLAGHNEKLPDKVEVQYAETCSNTRHSLTSKAEILTERKKKTDKGQSKEPKKHLYSVIFSFLRCEHNGLRTGRNLHCLGSKLREQRSKSYRIKYKP